MIHRHLDTTEWSKAAIDSAIEYGDLADWRELFTAVAQDPILARRVLEVAQAHSLATGSALAAGLVRRLWPDIG